MGSGDSSSRGNGAGKRKARSSRQLQNVSSDLGRHEANPISGGLGILLVLLSADPWTCLMMISTIVFSTGKENVCPGESRRVDSKGHFIARSHNNRDPRRYSKSNCPLSGAGYTGLNYLMVLV